MPPKGRTPGTPPRRRPRVAGISQRGRTGTARDGATDETTGALVEEQWADEQWADTEHAAPTSDGPAAQTPHPSDVAEDAAAGDTTAEDVTAKADVAAEDVAAEPAVAADRDVAPDDSVATERTSRPPKAAVAEEAVAEEDSTAAGDEDAAEATTRRPERRTSPARARAGLRPSPTARKPRRTEPEPATKVDRRDGRRLAGVQLIVLLLLVAIVFGAAAAFFRGQAARATPGSLDNRAVIDNAATSEVIGQVSKDIEVVLSYDYTKLDENERAASEVVTGKYADEFSKTFADVRKTAPEQKLVLTTTVLLAGVTMLNGDRAEVIATMDLAAVRDTTPYTSPGRVKVTANKVDGRWKIAEMTLL